MSELPESLSLWYLDDGSMAGPGEELKKAWDIVQEESRKIGLRETYAHSRDSILPDRQHKLSCGCEMSNTREDASREESPPPPNSRGSPKISRATI